MPRLHTTTGLSFGGRWSEDFGRQWAVPAFRAMTANCPIINIATAPPFLSQKLHLYNNLQLETSHLYRQIFGLLLPTVPSFFLNPISPPGTPQ